MKDKVARKRSTGWCNEPDSDVDMGSTKSVSSVRRTRSRAYYGTTNNGAAIADTDATNPSKSDQESEDEEEAVLRRLTGNYRRASEAHVEYERARAAEYAAAAAAATSDSEEVQVQVQADRVTGGTDDEYGDYADEMIEEHDVDEDDNRSVDGDGRDYEGGDYDDDDSDYDRLLDEDERDYPNDIHAARGNEDNEDVDFDEAEEDEDDDDDEEGDRNGSHRFRFGDDDDADEVLRTLHGAIAAARRRHEGSGDGAAAGGPAGFRNVLSRMFPGTGLGELLDTGSEIQGLVDNLERQHDDPFLVLEILNQINEHLLVMNGIVAERGIPVYGLTKQLVSILNSELYADHLEVQVVVCRCFYNLLEVNPDVVHVMVGCGAIEALQSKLAEISYIDLAEQTLQTLEMISRESGHEVLMRSNLPMFLQFLDFFTIHAQRKALALVANACEDIPDEKFDELKEVLPVVERVATEYTDQSCVESSWLTISRVISNFRKDPEKLSHLINEGLLKSLTSMLPGCIGRGQRSGIVGFGSCLKLIDSLSTLASASPEIALSLLRECDAGHVIKSALLNYEKTDVTKPIEPKDTDDVSVTIDALMTTPKELLTAFLKLVTALVPFVQDPADEDHDLGNFKGTNYSDKEKQTNLDRIQIYKDSGDTFERFAFKMFPILLSVYSSTVDYKIRRLCLVCILRIIVTLDKDELVNIVYGSNIASVLSSIVTQGRRVLDRDVESKTEVIKPSLLVHGALTIAHTLFSRAPELFLGDFEREGLLSHTENLRSRLEGDERVDRPTSKEPMISSQMSVDDDDDDDDNDDNDDGDDDGQEREVEHTRTQAQRSSFIRIHGATDDGASLLTSEEVLTLLDSLCTNICDDYKSLITSSKTPRSQNLKNLDVTKVLLQNCADVQYSYDQWMTVWTKVANTLSVASSFELISSGLITILLETLEREDIHSDCAKSFENAFCSDSSPLGTGEKLPLTVLVKQLEEALERTESFEIIGTEATNVESRASSMAKQLKLRLISTDPDIEEPDKQMLLMVHAVATFKSIDDFLHARLSRMRTLLRTFAGRGEQDEETLLRREVGDYHIEFSINGEVVPHGTIVYGAIYKAMQKTPHEVISPKRIFASGTHVIEFRKVQGKAPEFDEELYPQADTEDSDLESLGDPTTTKILRLLKELHRLNGLAPRSGASDALFLNYKLTAKLNRQFEEPLVVASGTLPDWCVSITRKFPFLFPIDARVFFLQSTSFGYSRLIDIWQSRARLEEQQEGQLGNNPNPNIQLGRPVRRKLRLSRKKLLQGAIKVIDGYASMPGLLEIEYFDEAGTGLGPTLEFYANVSKEFCRANLQMWRGSKHGSDEFINYPTGLFPKPISENAHNFSKVLHLFSVLGKFVARSLLDSRIIDFTFNPLFLALSQTINEKDTSEDSTLTTQELMDRLQLVDPDLARSLTHLMRYVSEFNNAPDSQKDGVEIDGVTLNDLMLTFMLPGYNIELVPHGESTPVTSENLEEYIRAILDYSVGSGVSCQINAFVDGFSTVFPFSSLAIFSPDELVRLLGNGEEDWSLETLLNVVHADHGYTLESTNIQNLLEVMNGFDKDQRRKFLQFLTGSPRLPIGGFKALHPDFTVVLKQAEDGLKPDDYLPSVMTCANYLKLPQYSSKEMLKKRLSQAMIEGANAFLLS